MPSRWRETPRRTASASSSASPRGRAPYCGDDPLAPDDSAVVVECGYDRGRAGAGAGTVERAVASRRYPRADGKLVRVTLGRERPWTRRGVGRSIDG